MLTPSLRTGLLVIAVLFVGTATGALVDNIYHTRVLSGVMAVRYSSPGNNASPQGRQKQRDEDMSKYLGLDQKQQRQVHAIVEDSRREFGKLHEKTDPQFQALEESSRLKIRAVLTEEQRRKYDAFRESKGTRGRPPTPRR